MVKVNAKYRPVEINGNSPIGDTFTDGEKVWRITSLWHHVKEQGLEVFDLPLCGVNLSVNIWDKDTFNFKSFVIHWKRANKVDLSYPIILDDDGFVMDGWHRVAKALFLGHSTIKAVRFDDTPNCDYLKVSS